MPDSLRIYWSKQNELYVEDSLVYYNNRIIVPQTLRQKMVKYIHESHFGICKSIARAKTVFYWPNMESDIEN